jgi:hypothetical protein
LGKHTKEAFERGVFKRFIGSQPGFVGLRWKYSSDGDRPDFVCPRGRIGVEQLLTTIFSGILMQLFEALKSHPLARKAKEV